MIQTFLLPVFAPFVSYFRTLRENNGVLPTPFPAATIPIENTTNQKCHKNLHDVESVCGLCPNATVIATHLDSVNHALLSSEDVRRFAVINNLKQVVDPQNGEWVER